MITILLLHFHHGSDSLLSFNIVRSFIYDRSGTRFYPYIFRERDTRIPYAAVSARKYSSPVFNRHFLWPTDIIIRWK